MRLATPAFLTLLTFAASANAQLRGVAADDIDRKADPCTDFDAYANGQWRATHPMPAIQTTWAIRTVTQDETRARLRDIAVEDAAKAAGLPKGSPGQMTGDFYASCIDEARVNALALKPLEPLLASVETVKDAKSLSAEIIQLQQVNISAPLNLSSTQDLHNTTQIIADLDLNGLGMPDRDYYLRDEPRFKTVREAYLVYIHKMFVLAGASDTDAARAVDAVMKIETPLAQARLSRVELRDPKLQDNPKRFAELKALAPHFDWDEEFSTLGVTTAGHANVDQPKLMQAFDGLLTSVSIEDWRLYLRWHVLNGEAAYLAAPFEEARFGFYGTTMTGVKEQRPRWQRCVIATDGMLGEALGHEYVDRYLPPEAKARAREMAVNIVNELKLSIESRDWMSAPTKASGNTSNSIVDSGTNGLVIDQSLFEKILGALSPADDSTLSDALRAGFVPSGKLDLAAWPTLTFVLEGALGADVKLQVAPDTYWQTDSPKPGYATAVVYGDNGQGGGQSILGLPLMNNYFTIFDRSVDKGLGAISFAPIARGRT